MDLSLIIPVCNEENTLENSFNKLKKVLSRLGRSEIIIADDGSTDNTKLIADRLVTKNRNVRHLYSKKRLGKGLALKRSLRLARGKIILFTDSDLSTDIGHIKTMVNEIQKGADICIGSRYMKDSTVKRGLIRRALSNSYRFLVRILFNTSITDFQCGLKVFRRSSLPIILKAKDKRWFWDTEMLLYAERSGLKISQIPVKWKRAKNSKVRLSKTSIYLLYKLLRLRFSI